MKKGLILVAILAIASAYSTAQSGNFLDKAKSVATSTGLDVNTLTSGIMGKLSPTLLLTAAQKPKVSAAITEYLAQKALFAASQKTNPAEYTQRQSGIFQGLKSTLAGILLKKQMNKFMGLKPATNDPSNLLSQLFF